MARKVKAGTVRVRHHYSGAASHEFWRRVNAFDFDTYEHGTLFHGAILLQEIEERVLAWLFNFEERRRKCLRVERVPKRGKQR